MKANFPPQFRNFSLAQTFHCSLQLSTEIIFFTPTGWVVFSQNFSARLFSHAPMFLKRNFVNLTLKRRDNLLVLVLARYMPAHRVVARKCSRTEWTWYSDALVTLTDVGS